MAYFLSGAPTQGLFVRLRGLRVFVVSSWHAWQRDRVQKVLVRCGRA